MNDKISFVTGATTGIGKEIARGLAAAGSTVIIGARDVARGEAARDDIAASTGNTRVSVVVIDVAEPASIRSAASAICATHPKLDVLVNNAGAWFTDRRVNSQGRELTFATNVLGPYLLSELLLAPLRAAAPSRIVNVVSGLASNYDASDLEWNKRKYDGFKVYAQSKAAARLLTFGLAERLKGTGIAVNAAAPGFVRTEFNRNARGFMAASINMMAKIFAQSPAEGADTPLWAATAPELTDVTGKVFDRRKEIPKKYDDPALIADLERALSASTAAA